MRGYGGSTPHPILVKSMVSRRFLGPNVWQAPVTWKVKKINTPLMDKFLLTPVAVECRPSVFKITDHFQFFGLWSLVNMDTHTNLFIYRLIH